MFNFDRERFLRIQNGAIGLKDELDEVIDELVAKGIKNVFFVGTGGAAILMYAAEYILKNHSTLPAFTEISSELMVTDHQHLGEQSLVILPSLSGTTRETVEVVNRIGNFTRKNKLSFRRSQKSSSHDKKIL